MDNEEGVILSLRYTFSVRGYCNTKRISPREIALYEEILKSGKVPTNEIVLRDILNGLTLRKRQMELFPKATGHYKSWGEEDVRDYWLRGHNIIVKDNPACKVYWGGVSGVQYSRGDRPDRVKLNGLEWKTALKSYIFLESGNKVSIHGDIIAERILQEDINKYSVPEFSIK